MTLYLVGLVICGVGWLIITFGAIWDWQVASPHFKQEKAQRMLWCLLGVLLIPIYPLAIVGAIILGILTLFRKGFRDARKPNNKEINQ